MSYDVYNQFKDKDFEELKTNILEDIEQAKEETEKELR